MSKAILLGNEAIARGVVEAGCEIACAYPGTPSSEILPAVARFADEMKTNTAVEWSANEKVAFETAVSAAMSGKRSCAVMKQVGLNVASDPFMSTALFKQEGGFLLIVADDPGPHSSQTEQDSRMYAYMAQIPCFDPASAQEAKDMVFDAFELSERYHVTAMLRPTGKIDHAKQDIELKDSALPPRAGAKFQKDASRWVTLPASVKRNHPRLLQANADIRADFESKYPQYNYEVKAKGTAKLGVIASGSTFAFLMDVIASSGRDDIDVLKIGTPVPLPLKMCEDFIARHEKVLLLEQTCAVVEMQLLDRTKVNGRWNGVVPSMGELLPEVIEKIIAKLLGEPEPEAADADLAEALKAMGVADRPPTLCPGCPHRSSFFSIRSAYPAAINPSDIGCYSLGVRQKGLDTVIDMGGSVTAASGFYLSQKVDGAVERPIIATIGDSTFYHMGIPGLASAVYNGHAFVLCILDNRITAMTGGQSSPNVGEKLRAGDHGCALDLEKVCRGLGVEYVKVLDAYATRPNVEEVRKAWEYAKDHTRPAVLVFRYPCITMLKRPPEPRPVTVKAEKCVGCQICINQFNCPGLVFDAEAKKAHIDERYCVTCGVCEAVCPQGAIQFVK